jgi:hypothetical protein
MPETEMTEDFRAPDATRHHTVFVMDPIAMLSKPNYLGSRAEIEAELDVVAVAIRAFYCQPPDQAMRQIAAFSARLTELAVLLHRVESQDRQYTRVRTQQVERLLSELDRQFKIASRLVEVMRQDLALLSKD